MSNTTSNATSACPCDGTLPAPPTNLPGLSHIAFRVGAFADFRRALLTPQPGEHELSNPPGSAAPGSQAWRPQAGPDLAVMMMEWWAYVADVLTFYNERIANQNYLRTADLPESVPRLIQLLGYRPRPAIGATGVLAALVSGEQTVTLPHGLQFQSKPGPGQEAQTFELDIASLVGPPDAVPANPPVALLQPTSQPASFQAAVARTYTARAEYSLSTRANQAIEHSIRIQQNLSALTGILYDEPIVEVANPPTPAYYNLLLQGTVSNVTVGTLLLLVPRDPSVSGPLLVSVAATAIQVATGGKKVTQLTLDFVNGDPPPSVLALTAAGASLQRPTQSMGLWSFYAGAINGEILQLAGISRQIRAGDAIILSAPSQSASTGPLQTVQTVQSNVDLIWYANASASSPTTAPVAAQGAPAITPLPIFHSQLTLVSNPNFPIPSGFATAALGTVVAQFGFVEIGTLQDQPPGVLTATTSTLIAVPPAVFANDASANIIIADSTGNGILATGSSAGDGTLTLGALPSPLPPLAPPFTVLYGLLNVSRGKTVANEILGSGDATIANQSFKLSQSPVTYLTQGATFSSTVSILVAQRPWTEVPTLYGVAADAEVFVTREDEAGKTHVSFGDGTNGARLPTGTNNVVATYRVGAGAASPPAGKLTGIAQSFPGLASILNPVAVGGGADPDPSMLIAQNAPRSVLTFGRAVSVYDYQALAAQAPGVSRASATWSWYDVQQRAQVTVYVGDDAAAVASAASVLASAGDPNRPVSVLLATATPVTLTITLVILPGYDADTVVIAATTALIDPTVGLFAAANVDIGQSVYDSQINAAVLAVDGTVAITAMTFAVGASAVADAGPTHAPGEGGYYDPVTVNIQTQVASNG